MLVYLNDNLVPKSEAKVSVFDHGFLYGDGIYETMRAYDGVIFMRDEHLMRLYRSASMIGLTIPKNIDGIKSAIYDTLRANNLQDAYVRLSVSRGYGLIGLDPDLCTGPTFVIIAEKMKDYPKGFYENGIRVIISETRRNLKDAINPRIKSLNFLNNILAKIEAKKENAYEALMLNASKFIAEGTISNVFFVIPPAPPLVKGGKGGLPILCTPSIDCGILDGITRKIVLDLAVRKGLMVREGEFTKDDIYSADEVFITNSTMEVMPVCRIDDVKYEVGKVARLLHQAYRGEVIAYVKNIKGSGPSLWGYE